MILVQGFTYAAVLWLLGLGVLLAWGVRWSGASVAGAMPTTLVVIALVTLAQVVLPFRYGIPALLVGLAMVAALGVAVARVIRWRRPESRSRSAETKETNWFAPLPVVGVLAVTMLAALVVLRNASGGSFEIASQTWDAMFDLNAIRNVVETGVVAPTRISDFASPLPVHAYYPSAFHALAAPFMTVFGTDAVVAGNVAAAIIAGGIWPGVVVLAARYVLGPGQVVSIASALFTLGFWGQPWGPLGWGVLWATATAHSFVPLAIAGYAGLLGLTRVPHNRWGALAMMLGGLGAVSLFHPRVAVVAGVALFGVSEVLVLARSVTRLRSGDRRAAAKWLVAAMAPLPLVVFIVFFVGRGNSQFAGRGWPVDLGLPKEVLHYVLNGPVHSTPQVLTAVLLVIGSWVLVRRRKPGLIVIYGVAVLLDVLTATIRMRMFDGVARFWYTDRYRTVELPAFPGILLAVVGAEFVQARLARVSRTARVVVASVASVLIVGLGVANASSTLSQSYIDAATDGRASLVSPREITWFQRIAEVVPRGQRVLNNANDGSALLYAYTGVKPVFLVAGDRASTLAGKQLWDNFKTMEPRNMCDAVQLDNVHWVLNNGEPYSNETIPPLRAPGIEVPDDYWATRLVISDGDNRLYQIYKCPWMSQ